MAEKISEELVVVQRTEHPYIDRKPGVCGGKPKIVGTRLPVWVLAGYHKMGLLDDEILRMYSHITAAQFYDALSYYYDHKDEIDEFLAKNTEEYWMKKSREPTNVPVRG